MVPFFHRFILNLSNYCSCFPPLSVYPLSLTLCFPLLLLFFVYKFFNLLIVVLFYSQLNQKFPHLLYKSAAEQHRTKLSFGINIRKIWLVSIEKSMSDRKSLRAFKDIFPFCTFTDTFLFFFICSVLFCFFPLSWQCWCSSVSTWGDQGCKAICFCQTAL